MTTKITYEHPISARIRALLAFEIALARFDAVQDCDQPWQTRCAAMTALELERLAARNLKRDLIKELKHQIEAMERLSLAPEVDHQLLGNIITQQSRMVETLKEPGAGAEGALADNELLGMLRNRLWPYAAGSVLDLDSPAYQHWLSRPAETHRAAVMGWIQPFARIKQALDMVLGLIRSSTASAAELAFQGYYHGEFDREKRYQLLR